MNKIKKTYVFQEAVYKVIYNEKVMVNINTGDIYYTAKGKDGYYCLNKWGEWKCNVDDEIFTLEDILSMWYIEDKEYLKNKDVKTTA